MKRVQRTQQNLAKYCAEQRRGFDATELAALLGASRHNLSADLNLLWRDGLVIKLQGRPVLFWDPQVYKQLHAELPIVPTPPPARDPLSEMIGAQESLRLQIEQAKAAVLYPPVGLHTMVVGPTGVGKSYLAELMHAFGVGAGKLAADAPFVTLNCAVYAANPQLLMAHLFGAVKGAYTGADRDREGLVERANGGILFLDEVHRLPDEGQEMLFRLIDKGLFRRLGETGAERRVQVMLVVATTERIESSLLRTFTRRIPMVITLPAMAERTVSERFRFVRRFLRAEAGKIGIDIVVPQETLRMLLEYECLGNIGQLGNDVQLACARLFLSYLTQKRETMELAVAHLPEHIHRTLPRVRHRSHEVAELLRSTGGRLIINKGSGGPMIDIEPGEGPISFYGLIERQMHELQSKGMTPAEAEQVAQGDIADHFKDFVGQVRHKHQSQRQELSTLVGSNVIRAVERALLWAEERLNRTIPERILYALALHVHASRERVEMGRSLDYQISLPSDDTPEAHVAAGLVELLGRELGFNLPSSDIAFATMLLRPEEKNLSTDRQIGVVVLAHGRVASAIVEVAHHLTGITLAHAIDMDLDQEPAVVQEQLVQLAQEDRFPGGLLLLVDMGSLEAMGEAVSQATAVQVRTIGMVSSALVVEAIHQASSPGATLDHVYQSVLTARGALLGRDTAHSLPQVILTFCFTGVGSAHTLAKIVREVLPGNKHLVDVIPASIGTGAGWHRLVSTLLRSHRLIAVVGPFNPKIPGIPYVSTEEIVVGPGARRLRLLAMESTGGREEGSPVSDPHLLPSDQVSLFGQMAVSLGEHLKATNPAATIPVIAKGMHAMEQYLGRPLDDALRIGLMMHLACLLDRKVLDRLQSDSGLVASPSSHGGNLPWLPEVLREMTGMFHVRLTSDDLDRLDEIISQSIAD